MSRRGITRGLPQAHTAPTTGDGPVSFLPEATVQATAALAGDSPVGFTPAANAFLPNSIAGSLLWVRADTGITKDGGDLVSAWSDMTGQSNNLAQGTGGNQPLYEAAGFNGFKSILFDGSSDWMGLSDGTLCAHVTGTDKPYTIAFALQHVSITSNDVWFAFDENAGTSRDVFYETAPTSLSHNRVDDASGVFGGGLTANLDTSARRYVIVYSGTTTEIFKDNVSIGSVACNAGAATFDRFTIGAQRIAGGAASSFSNIRIAEIVVYDTALGVADRASLDAYFSSRYGL